MHRLGVKDEAMLKNLLVAALLTGTAVAPALAQPGPPMWQPLGRRPAAASTEQEIRVGPMVGNFEAVALEALHGVPIVRRVIIHYDENERTAQVVELGARKIDRSNPRILIPLRACCHTIDRIDVEFAPASDGEVVVSAE
jgi:hypothetical protein